MGNLVVFAVIGALAGAAVRLLYPGRRATRIMATMICGIVGAVAGGMISWIYWPAVDGSFQTGNLLVSILGALVAIGIAAGVVYVRMLKGYSNTPL
jgi:uncharacterized membrane protein YeaQ/YmgE (transglycosylase-associated protein family)